MLNRTIIASFLLSLIAGTFAAAQPVQDQIRLTTPGAPWTLVLDGGAMDLRQVKIKPADERSAYFLIYDQAREMNISFYIEPVDKCRTSDECRDFVLNTGNPAWGKYQDLAKAKVGDFSYFEFFRPEAQGMPLQMFDMYAQYVDRGYWIDLHISKALYKKEDHALFENLIKTLGFAPKNAAASDSQKHVDKIEKASASWLALWDGAKCVETYNALSAISKAAVSRDQWVPYCEEGRKALGKSKSRTLIASSLIKSLPSKPDRAGATLHYRSTFENTPAVVELVTFVLEKDGSWTVANYLVQ